MQNLFGIDWMDASLYAIVLNTSRIPVQEWSRTAILLLATAADEREGSVDSNLS